MWASRDQGDVAILGVVAAELILADGTALGVEGTADELRKWAAMVLDAARLIP